MILEGLSAGLGENNLSSRQVDRAALVFDIMDIFWSSQISLVEGGSPELARQYQTMRTRGYSSQPMSINTWIPAGFEDQDLDPAGVRSLRIGAYQLELDDWAALFDVKIFSEPRGMLINDLVRMVGATGYDTIDGGRIAQEPDYDFDALVSCLILVLMLLQTTIPRQPEVYDSDFSHTEVLLFFREPQRRSTTWSVEMKLPS